MVRTVKVRLELDRNDYKAGLRDAANDTRGFDGEVRAAGKDLGAMGVEVKTTATEVSKLGDDVKLSSREVGAFGDETAKTKTKTTGLGDETDKTKAKIVDLAKEINTAKASLAAMGEEFRKTGQIDTSKFNEVSRTLRDLERAKAELDKLTPGDNSKGSSFLGSLFKFVPSQVRAAGVEAGKTLGSGVQSVWSAVTAPSLMQYVIGAAVVTSPLLGAVLAGGVLGAAGLGGIAGGVILQFDRIKPAAADLWSYVKEQATDATSSFGPAAAAGINAMKREMDPFWSSVRTGLNSLTPYVSNLLVKLGQGLAALGPGLGKALEAAGPVLGALGNALPFLFQSFSNFFRYLAVGGKGAAEGIYAIVKMLGVMIESVGLGLMAFSKLFEWIISGLDKVTGVLAKIPGVGAGPIHSMIHDLATSFDAAKLSTDGAAAGLDQYATSAAGADTATGGLTGALGGMNNSMSTSIATMTGLDGATIGFKQSVQGLKDAIGQNGKSLDINTAAGQANVQAMLAGVQSAEALRKAQIDSGLSAAYADDQYRQNVESLRAVMINAHMNRDEIDRMIGKYLQVPGQIATNVALAGVSDAISKGQTLTSILNSLDGKVSRSAVITQYISEKGERPFSVPGFSRWGNVYEHAAVGALRDASVYSAVSSGARYAFAEPQTGGEAFIPKNGDLERSRSIWSYVGANWLGMRPAGGGVTNVTNVTIPVQAGMGVDGYRLGQQIVDALRPFVENNGGNVQMAIVGRQVQ